MVTTDFVTAEPYDFSTKFLSQVSRRIINEVEGIALVTYNVTSKPPVRNPLVILRGSR